jgi:hypothetical protein
MSYAALDLNERQADGRPGSGEQRCIGQAVVTQIVAIRGGMAICTGMMRTDRVGRIVGVGVRYGPELGE